MYKIQDIFNLSYQGYCSHFNPSDEQNKAAYSIMNCKSGRLGYSISICEDCDHLETHNNSCRNRHCPCCQAILKEHWIDNRKSEVIDAPYFHVVFTLPAELNPLIYANQHLLYSLLHKCVSQTLLELSADSKYLGATPGIVQILHTWGQELNYHPHMHCCKSIIIYTMTIQYILRNPHHETNDTIIVISQITRNIAIFFFIFV